MKNLPSILLIWPFIPLLIGTAIGQVWVWFVLFVMPGYFLWQGVGLGLSIWSKNDLANKVNLAFLILSIVYFGVLIIGGGFHI